MLIMVCDVASRVQLTMLLNFGYCNGKIRVLELDSSTEHMHA